MDAASWKKISTYSFLPKAELIKATLEANGIKCLLLNQQDSAYLFGEIQLFVHPDQYLKALQIIKEEDVE